MVGPPDPPVRLTTFVGRAAELAEVEELVRLRRLVTLTGVGGCGKTRLAGEVCQRLPSAAVVDLGLVSDPGVVPASVAAALGLPAEPTASPLPRLAARLADRELLLCLDTCEHVLDAAAELADELLRGCPGLSVLATSREPLGVEGETVWRVPTLRPDEAATLFADRAALVRPRFELTEHRAGVAAVCARVDNIPLAVELAAAWVRVLSPAQIATGLEESARLLSGRRRRSAPRHRTMQASMAWSHDLLTDRERVLFRRLAVFASTFGADAAGYVDAEPDRSETLSLVGRLVDTSLVTTVEDAGQVRYRLLDTVRDYAEDRLVAAGEAEQVRDRHLDHFLALAERAEPGLDSDQDRWLELLDRDRANVDAALEWALVPGPRADRGRRLAAATARHWQLRGRTVEGLDALRRAVELAPTDESALQARLLTGTAMLAMVSGHPVLVTDATTRAGEQPADDGTRARALTLAAFPVFFRDFADCQQRAAAAEQAAEAAGDPFARDFAAVLQGYSLQTRNRHAEAVAVARAAYDRSLARGDRFCAGFARGVEIFTTAVGGDVTGAVAVGREVLEIVTPLRDYFAVGTNTSNAAQALVLAGRLAEARRLMDPIVRSLATTPEADVVGFMVPYGLLHLYAGEPAEALRWFRAGVRRMSDGGQDWTAGRCLPGLVGALRRLGRTGEATEWAARAVAVESAFGAMYELSDVLDEQARLLAADDRVRARDVALQALTLRKAHDVRLGYPASLELLAVLGDDAAEAVRLLALADALRAAAGAPLPAVDRAEHGELVAGLRDELGEAAFAARWRGGAAAEPDAVVAALTRGRGPRVRPPAGWESLTPTETEVVRLVSTGLSNPEIAARLYMSRSTVKTHLGHIYAKLGVANRTALARLASSQPPQT
jgi:predicted ATPase/DNA-binding CsgD family transcriptional regulator